MRQAKRIGQGARYTAGALILFDFFEPLFCPTTPLWGMNPTKMTQNLNTVRP